MNNIKETNSKLFNTNKTLQDKITKMECYSRRNNLIYENERPLPILSKTIRAVWSRMGVSNPDGILIYDIHWDTISEINRPIIVRFVLRTHRHAAWAARRNLRGTGYLINEYLPDEYKKARGVLLPVLKAAKTAGLKATLALDKVPS